MPTIGLPFPPCLSHAGKKERALIRGPNGEKEDQISKKTLEISPADDGEIYTKLADLADDLPDNSPRFVLLSYPLTLVRFLLPSTSYSTLRAVFTDQTGSIQSPPAGSQSPTS